MNRRMLVASLVLLAGCEDGTGPRPPLTIETVGRLERSSEIQVVVRSGTDTVAASEFTLTAQPASAIQPVSPGRIRLVEAGQVVLTAVRNTQTGSQTITVATPPMLVLDLIRDGNRDLYTVALDGGDFRRLTTAPAEDRAPTVAGGRVVFVSFRNGNGELYSMQLSGAPGSETRLTQTNLDESNPSLSPNGQRIAFERPLAAGQPGKIWFAPANDLASAQRATTNFGSAAAIDGSPVWATNELLVFLSTALADADLFTVASPPATPAELVRAAGPQVDPAASPDGSEVVYGANISNDLELHVVNVQTRQTRVLLRRPGTDSRAVWLSGSRIAFLAFDPAPMKLYWFDSTEAQPALHEVPVGTGLNNQTRLAVVR